MKAVITLAVLSLIAAGSLVVKPQPKPLQPKVECCDPPPDCIPPYCTGH